MYHSLNIVVALSKQDEANPVFWLATWPGKILPTPDFPLGPTRKKFSFSPCE